MIIIDDFKNLCIAFMAGFIIGAYLCLHETQPRVQKEFFMYALRQVSFDMMKQMEKQINQLPYGAPVKPSKHIINEYEKNK